MAGSAFTSDMVHRTVPMATMTDGAIGNLIRRTNWRIRSARLPRRPSTKLVRGKRRTPRTSLM